MKTKEKKHSVFLDMKSLYFYTIKIFIFLLISFSNAAFADVTVFPAKEVYYLSWSGGSFQRGPFNTPNEACSSVDSTYNGSYCQHILNGTWSADIITNLQCPIGYMQKDGVTCAIDCPSGKFFDSSAYQCVSECPQGHVINSQTNQCQTSCSDKTGQKAASGYIDLGSAGSGGSPETTVCHDGCAAGFSQESTNSTVLMLGVKHYFAHGSYIYNGNACTPGAPLPPVLAALPGDTCAPGEVLSEKTGEPACIPENGGGGGTGGGGGNGGGSQAVITFYHNDPSGSPIVATDESGNLLWKENYRPYGGKLNTSTSSEDNPIGFHGKPFDDHTGLSYMGARYYHPVLGRFTGVDPIGFLEENIHSHNRYAYANNNPYKYVDPDGRNAGPVIVGGVILVGAKLLGKKIASDAAKQAAKKQAVNSVGRVFSTDMSRNMNTTLTSIKNGGDNFFTTKIKTAKGDMVDIAAELIVNGDQLHISEFTVYGAEGDIEKNSINRDFLASRDDFKQAAKENGFKSIRLSGRRAAGSSSANPGKIVDLITKVE